MGLSGGKDKDASTTVNLPSTFSFSLAPKVGYYLSDDLSVGVEVGLNSRSTKTPKEYSGGSDDSKYITSGWDFGVFGRYKVMELNKFSVLLEGSLGIGGTSSKLKTGSSETKGDPTSTFGIAVLPVLEYSLTDKLSLEANLNFLGLGYWSETEKNIDDKKIKYTTNGFGLSVNNGTNSIISSVLSVGLIYKL